MVYSRFSSNVKKQNVCSVNEYFFEKWSSDMAYVLGFFAADGCMTKNAKRENYYIEFVSTDLEILEKIKIAMQAEQRITKKIRSKTLSLVKQGYRIQIGSKKLFSDLIVFGFTPNKSKTLDLPELPDSYFADFLRGYFDGDGCSNCCSYYAKDRRKVRKIITAGFACGSKSFLRSLKIEIKRLAGVTGGTLCPHSNNFALTYSTRDTRKLFNFMYNNLSDKIFLERKYLKFKKDLEEYGSVA